MYWGRGRYLLSDSMIWASDPNPDTARSAQKSSSLTSVNISSLQASVRTRPRNVSCPWEPRKEESSVIWISSLPEIITF